MMRKRTFLNKIILACFVIFYLELKTGIILAEEVPQAILIKSQSYQVGTIDCSYEKNIIELKNIRLGENRDAYFLSSPELDIVVDKKMGALYKIISKEPDTKEIMPPVKNGSLIYIWNKDKGWFSAINFCKKWKIGKGKEEGRSFISIKTELISLEKDADSLAEGEIEYRLFEDRFNIKATVYFKKDDPSNYEIGITQNYDGSLWTRQLYPSYRRLHIYPVEQKSYQRYYDIEEDVTKEREGYPLKNIIMPFGILEGPDRFFLLCYLDINSFMLMSPNRFNGFPSFSTSLNGLKRGKNYTFDYTIKVFPKPKNTITEVCRWYAQNLYSTNPLTKGIVRMPKKLGHKTVPEGNLVSSAEPMEATKKWKMFNIWYGGPKEDIKRLQDMGYYAYVYFNQLRGAKDFSEDKPPYKRWMMKCKHGLPCSFEKDFISEEEAYSTGTAVYYDFCDPDFIKWYIKEVKDCIDRYNPDGIAWDMGWETYPVPCYRHPKDGMRHGMIRVMHDIYVWMKKKHPEKKILINMALFTPQLLYVDGCIIDEGITTDKFTMDANKFYNIPFFSLNYPDFWSDTSGIKGLFGYNTDSPFFRTNYPDYPLPGEPWKEKLLYVNVRNLASGVTFGAGRGFEFFSTEFAHFTARANTVPLITENNAVIFLSENEAVTGAIWADRDNIMVAIFNDSDKDASFEAELNSDLLRKYGHSGKDDMKFLALDAQSAPRDNATFKKAIDKNRKIIIRGILGPKELMLAQ